MLKVLVARMGDRLESPKPKAPPEKQDPETKPLPNDSTFQNHKVLSDPNYENLEKVLQKYEAEIREHIRIEQQLKIYSDGLEEKISEKEAEMEQKVKEMERQISQLNEDKAKLSKQLYDTKFEKIFLEKKLKQKKESASFQKDGRDPSIRKVG